MLRVRPLQLLFAMVAPLFLRDATPRGWFRSLAVIHGLGSASLIAASTLAPWPLVADAGFPAVLFVAMLVQACAPRALGGAMTAVVAFYLRLYLVRETERRAPATITDDARARLAGAVALFAARSGRNTQAALAGELAVAR
jgi:hypothetical protein